MDACIFCRIAAGEAPCYKLYEDETTMVILDIHPTSEGHALVITKEHYRGVFDMPEALAAQTMKVAKRVTDAYHRLGIGAVNLLNASGEEAQQSIMHYHLHVVPRKQGDGLDLWFHHDKNAKLAMLEFHDKARALLHRP